MNITFLLGNGFDRALGLKTGYSHFYEWYCMKNSESDVVNNFRKSIDEEIKCTDENTVKLWSDAELGLAKVTEKYAIDDFVVCCEDMHDMLAEYLSEQDAKFVDTEDTFHQIVKAFSSPIIDFQQDMKPTEQQLLTNLRTTNKDEDSFVNFITLNYTSTSDKIYKELSKKPLTFWNVRSYNRYLKTGKLIHAHGYVDRFPILGVCNPSLIANQQYLDNPAFKALMIKKESIDAVGETWRKDTNTLIKNSDIICVFGASLGESDSDYWETIANWLRSNDNHRLIIYWYDSNIKKTNISIYQKYITERKIQEKFLGFANFDDSIKEQLCNRIHIVINAPHMFVLPEELKVKYPAPESVKRKRVADTEEPVMTHEYLSEIISKTAKAVNNIDNPV